jgi:hypothetical protein
MPPFVRVLHHSTGWVEVPNLIDWIEYSNGHVFRNAVLTKLHEGRLIEFDKKRDRAQISPWREKEVEERLLKPARDSGASRAA